MRVGLTGNIGSGKTTVCRIFETLNIPVFYADNEAKKLYSRRDVKNKLKTFYGNSIFNERGEIDVKILAAIIFQDKKALQFINDLIHPLVFEVYNNWLKRNEAAAYTVFESAIIFENNLQHNFNKTVMVVCPEQVRIKRVMERDNLEKEKILARIKNQWPEDKKKNLADFLINNDGNEWLIPQVLEIHKALTNN